MTFAMHEMPTDLLAVEAGFEPDDQRRTSSAYNRDVNINIGRVFHCRVLGLLLNLNKDTSPIVRIDKK